MITLPNTINEFNFKSLAHGGVDDAMQLQSDVLNSLNNDQKFFFKYRSEKDLVSHLDGGMPLLGLYKNNTLQAMVMVTYPDNAYAKNLQGYPMAKESFGWFGVIQSLLVSPSLQGCGTSSTMIGLSAKFAFQAGRRVLWAKIAKDNEKSIRAFKKCGFAVNDVGDDYRQHYPVQYLAADVRTVNHCITAKAKNNLVRVCQ